MPSPLRFSLPAALLTSVLLAGCGAAEPSAGPATDGTPPATPSATPPEPTPTKTTSPRADGSTSERASPSAAGGYSVVGVRRGTRLEVRKAAGSGSPVVGRLAPMAHNLVPVGAPKSAGDTLWQKVRAGRVTGWVDSSHLAQFGKATVHPELAQTPIGETRVALARNAARQLGLTGPLVVAKARHPVVILDHFGEGDDSVRGQRLRVVVMFGEAGFQVKEAASRPICARGASKGLCL